MDRTWVSAGIKFAIVNDDALPSLLVQRVARLRAKKDILPRYLGYWIGNRIFESYVLGIQTGLGVPHVSGGQISSFPVRVPSLPAQEALIERLDSIVDGTKFLRKEYRRKLADIADLRQSLLQRAFSGQLTA
jgi:type I restriction enzyme S subunit